MSRLLALVLLANCALASGCCHCYQRNYIPGQGPIAAVLAPPIKRMAGCSKGCGEIYWGEWVSDPPDSCDPCCNGEFVGPRDCCAGRPHTRLCLVGAFERIRGIRGSCLGYCGGGGCSDGCCGDGSCGAGGCSSCGDGAEWSEGEMPTEYSEPGVESMQPTTSYMPERRSTPVMSDPGWDRTVPRDIPGVPIPTGRRPGGPRSANYRSGSKPIRSVSYEEAEQAEVAAEDVAEDVAENISTQAKVHPWESAAGKPRDEREPALLEEVLPDPRASYRR